MQYLVFICLLVAVASSPVPDPIIPLAKADSKGLFSTILEVNKQIKEEVSLFEGDIVQTMSTKNALKDKSKRWPNGVVPYTISGEFDSYAKSQIQEAIDRYHAKTCIKFVTRTSEQNYVEIVEKGGCYSSVGVKSGAQELSLASGCYGTIGIIMHEMMHAIGFWHEQSRTDRDGYVTINWNNIEDGKEDNFDSYTSSYIDDLGVSYDYESIMHYSQYAFSKNDLPTIVPKQSGAVIGNRVDFSTTDVTKINKYYDCINLKCFDLESDCSGWANLGYCDSSSKYYDFMKDNCAQSCSFCYNLNCFDLKPDCGGWASDGYCDSNSKYYDYMKDNCVQACSFCCK